MVLIFLAKIMLVMILVVLSDGDGGGYDDGGHRSYKDCFVARGLSFLDTNPLP